jgi:LEA14-like dessication related protein
MKAEKIFGLALIVGFIFMVGRYFWKQFNKLYYACYTIAGGSVRKISIDSVDMTLIFKIMNKSDFNITVEKQYYEVFFDSVRVAIVSKTDSIAIAAHSISNFPIDVKFSPKALVAGGIKSIQNIIKDRSKVKITTKGYLDVATGIIKVNKIPFEYVMTLAEFTDPVEAEPLPDEYKCPSKF